MGDVDTNTLTTLAEVGVTIIGISGLVTVFLSRGTLHALDRIRFILIVLPAGTATTMSFVPQWCARLLEDPVQIWWYSSAAMLTMFMGINFALAGLGYMRLAISREGMSIVHPVSFWLSWLIPLVMLCALVGNLLSWPVPANQTAFEVALVLAMAQAVNQFTSLVLFRPTRATS
jgi:hypothetical protein